MIRIRPFLNNPASYCSILLCALFVYLYKDVIINLVKTWAGDGNYSHGFFVPILVGYIIWSKRKELKGTQLRPFWPAVIFVFLSGLILLAGQLTVHRFSQNLSFILMIFSLILLVLGTAWTKKLLFPLAFLIFMIPLPELFTRKVTWPLQLFSSYISTNFLSTLNYPVFREGNIIQLSNITLSVVEACSGLRSILALSFLAATSAYFVLKSNWKRIFIIFCAFPVAIMLNWARITGTALIATHLGTELALGFFHNFSGLLIFAVASILIGAIMLFLRNKEDQTTSGKTREIQAVQSKITIKSSTILVSSLVLFALSLYANFLFSLKPLPPVDLDLFPVRIGPYVGTSNLINPAVTEFSRVTQDRSFTFRDLNKPPIQVYLGYYRTGRDLKGFFHGTDVCLPGAGWKILRKEKIYLTSPGFEERPVEAVRYVSTKSGVTQILVTWIQAGHNTGTGARQMRFKLFLNTIIHLKYSDVTKIMIQTVLSPEESEEQALARLREFISTFYPTFNKLVT